MASSSSSHQENVEQDPFSGIEPQSQRIKPCVSPKLFDVFINHRGPDVKGTLALQLYYSLQESGFRAFLDSQEMELGDSFPATLRNAICSASVQIAIFSKGYAESPWCLAELALMLQTKAKIIPVFYDVDPSDLRYIEKGVYADAFNQYEKKGRYLNKLKEWKEALHSVSFMYGYEFSQHKHDQDKMCKNIVSAVQKEAEKTKLLHVSENPVGLDELVEDFERCCKQKREAMVKIVGIFGMGGSGKTTLAKELFNRKHCEYDGSCFLFDVREASAKSDLSSLQTKLLRDLVHLQDPAQLQSTDEGKSYLKYHLRRSSFLRFLIVLDDIDHKDQLDALLVRDALNSGSLVIVTTRDERVLLRAGITLRHKLKGMDLEHSRELFCWNAFHQPYAATGYKDLVERFVKVCGGLPLSLQVLGGHVFGSTDRNYWHVVLDEVRKTMPEDIKRRVKISFDALNNEQKQIFMDIACFFIGKPKSMAIRIWEGSGWSAEFAVQTLKDKCLVEVVWSYWDEFDDDKLAFRMHDHLRDFGREMADELSPPCRLWRPRYLKSLELKQFKNILAETNGRCLLSVFDWSFGAQITCFVGNSDDPAETLTALLWLQLDLNWSVYTSIPSWIPLQNVQCLRIVQGCLRRLWQNDTLAPFHLKELLLHKTSLAECTNSLEMLGNLEKLVLRGRYDNDGMLIEGRFLSESLKNLTHLRSLVSRHFQLSGEVALNNNGESTTFASPMRRLEKIEIREEKHVSRVSISGDCCQSLQYLHLESMESLVSLDLNLVITLNYLELRSCTQLKAVSGISDLEKLVILDIRECSELEELSSLACLSCLERIIIDRCGMLKNITGIEQLEGLKYMHLSAGHGAIWDCIHRLQRLPSEFTSVIGRAVDGAESILNTDLFSNVIDTNAGSEIHIHENGMPEASLKMMQHSLSAIIVCAVVQSTYGEIIQIPLPPSNSIESYMERGEWIVTIVVIAKTDWIPSVSFGTDIKKGCIVTVNNGDEGKTLDILKRIIDQLYQT